MMVGVAGPFPRDARRVFMDGIWTILLMIGVWFAIRYLMRKAGLPT
jgi:hypothetical protein